MQILRDEWKKETNAAIFKEDYELITPINIAITYAILRMAEHKLPFKLMNIGGGVKKLTRKVDTCPKCHGTGKV